VTTSQLARRIAWIGWALDAAALSSGTPDEVQVTRLALAKAIEAELKNYFFDGVSLILGQYAVDHIIGGTLLRVFPLKEFANI
jgi:hypothetical protein